MTENKIAETISKLLHEDKLLQGKFEELYQKKCFVFCEYNPRKYPKDNDAPFIYINVDTALDDLSLTATEMQIGLVLGIVEKEEIATEYGTKLKALEVLTDVFLPRIVELLRGIPQIFIEKVEKDFVFENFPLCMVNMTVLIKQNTPIGARKRQ